MFFKGKLLPFVSQFTMSALSALGPRPASCRVELLELILCLGAHFAGWNLNSLGRIWQGKNMTKQQVTWIPMDSSSIFIYFILCSFHEWCVILTPVWFSGKVNNSRLWLRTFSVSFWCDGFYFTWQMWEIMIFSVSWVIYPWRVCLKIG